MKPKLIALCTVMVLFLNLNGQNPVIQSAVNLVSADSLEATMQHLQGYGTRYLLANNRRDIARWLVDEFLRYGYVDAVIDSFQCVTNWPGGGDTLIWQYNVVCTLPGKSAPDEITVVGGHLDSFSTATPFTSAPGADDNGSGTAATLEIARVIKEAGYEPETTIRFVLFAGEETGYFGSKHDAESSKAAGDDIRYMFNMDMIASKYNNDSVYLFRYLGVESAYEHARAAYEAYTGLHVFEGPKSFEARSDSYTYSQYGYQSTWAFEYNFSTVYHTSQDIVANCNMDYCTRVTKGALATILEFLQRPFVTGLKAHSGENVTLSWNQTSNARAQGYRVYRSEEALSGFVALNTAPVTDTIFMDALTEPNKIWYYNVRLVNTSNEESVASNTVRSAKFNFSDTLFVVACLKETNVTADSILQFYAAVLDTIPYRWFDMNDDNPLTLDILTRYRSMLWVCNTLAYDQIPVSLSEDLEAFFENHGHLMFAGFNFSKFMLGNIGFPFEYGENSIGSRYFKLDSAFKTTNSYMYRAYPEGEGYDTLWVDPEKSLKPGVYGELYNIEVFSPAPGGIPIYRFDSRHDPGTTQGSQQGKIVGVEYMGDDFKTILLSFPLYYLDTSDAHDLLEYIMRNKFGNSLGIPEPIEPGRLDVRAFPNPSSGLVDVFLPDIQAQCTLSLFTLSGQEVLYQDLPAPATRIDISHLPVGMYLMKVSSNHGVQVIKLIKE